MPNEELSHEEENHLLNLACIPLLVFFPFLGVYFVYLMHNNLLKSVFDVLIHIGLVLAIAMPAIVFLTFEVLYSRRIKKPPRFLFKRFIGRMMITSFGASTFFITISVFLLTLSSLIGERNALLLSFATWAIVWFACVVGFKEIFAKVYKGKW